MNDNAKVFSLIEMREMMIDTSDYQMIEEAGEFTGILEMKAQGHKKSIRIFSHSTMAEKSSHRFSGGSLTSDFTICQLARSSDFFYSESNQKKVYLEKIEIIENV